MSAIQRSFAFESINDESVEIFNRAYNNDSTIGAATNKKPVNGGVKSNWVNGNTGAVITADNELTKSVTGSGANEAKRSVLFKPFVSFGLISERDLTMEAQRKNELQSVLLSGTQIIKGVVKQEEITCRISHINVP